MTRVGDFALCQSLYSDTRHFDLETIGRAPSHHGRAKPSQVKSTLFRQGSPISHWLVSKGALRKRLHDKNLKIKNYFKIMYKDFKK